MRFSKLSRLTRILIVVILLLAAIGAAAWLFSSGMLGQTQSAPLPMPATAVPPTPGGPTAEPGPPQTLVTFRAQLPPGTPEGETVYLNILDEVTGLGWNAQLQPMQPDEESGAENAVTLTLPFPIGTMVKYRYERQSGQLRMAEHLSDGSAVRYRLQHVDGQATITDVISRWTDTPYSSPSGRISGQVMDGASGQPAPNLLVAAGGAQTITGSDGSFMLEGLPPGVHNLVVYAMDGAYQPFQQGARVAEGSTTPATIQLQPAQFVNIIFVARMPEGTPPVVPLRLAGNLTQLGNTFANLGADMSSLSAAMPVMNQLPDGRYKLTVPLPVGADIRYKYTLGDGFWNAEHNPDGSWRLRQLIVPDHSVALEETIETWYAGKPNAITYDMHAPADTPAEDFVALQFNPGLGWTQPVPMWKLADNRWGYILYSPLNLPLLSYRYCRNGQCGVADDAATPGPDSQGRPVELDGDPKTIHDMVEAWAYWSGGESAILPEPAVAQRGPGFAAGIQFVPAYHPSWKSLLPAALDSLANLNAGWLMLSPTWSYGRNAPGNALPILAPLAGKDASWPELADAIQQARSRGINTAVYPAPRFAIPRDEWWQSAPRDESWWQVWFEQYRQFALHHADLANRSGAPALVLGGEWLAPALPGGKLPDGSPSGVPADAETRWRSIIQDVRSRYSGQVAWAASYQTVMAPPPFLDAVDRLYVEIPILPGQTPASQLGADPGAWLDNSLLPSALIINKPVTLAAACPSDPDLQVQVDCYAALLSAASQRDWITGFIAQDYYPPVALQDPTASVHGKPASSLLAQWFVKVKEMP